MKKIFKSLILFFLIISCKKTYKKVDMSIYDTTPFIHHNDSDRAVIVIHGFLASSQQMTYINKHLKDNSFAVISPNLIGHGTKIADLEKITASDWIKQIEQVVKENKNKYKKIYLLGLSLGGIISLNIAERNTDIDGVIIINTGLDFNAKSKSIHIAPYFQESIKYVVNPRNFIKDPDTIDKFTYKMTPVKQSVEMLKLAKVTNKDLRNIKIPILIFKSIEDKYHKKNGIRVYDKVSSDKKKLIHLKNSYHDAVLDYDKDIINEEIIKFLNEL